MPLAERQVVTAALPGCEWNALASMTKPSPFKNKDDHPDSSSTTAWTTKTRMIMRPQRTRERSFAIVVREIASFPFWDFFLGRRGEIRVWQIDTRSYFTATSQKEIPKRKRGNFTSCHTRISPRRPKKKSQKGNEAISFALAVLLVTVAPSFLVLPQLYDFSQYPSRLGLDKVFAIVGERISHRSSASCRQACRSQWKSAYLHKCRSCGVATGCGVLIWTTLPHPHPPLLHPRPSYVSAVWVQQVQCECSVNAVWVQRECNMSVVWVKYECNLNGLYGCMSVWRYDNMPICDCMVVCKHGCMTVRVYGHMAVWLYGCMAAWLYDCMAVWLYDGMAVWQYGCMVVWLYDCMAVCQHAYMAVWLCGRMAIWRHAYMAVWLYDCMIVWLCGCMPVLPPWWNSARHRPAQPGPAQPRPRPSPATPGRYITHYMYIMWYTIYIIYYMYNILYVVLHMLYITYYIYYQLYIYNMRYI